MCNSSMYLILQFDTCLFDLMTIWIMARLWCNIIFVYILFVEYLCGF